MPLLLIIVVVINHQRRVWKDLFWVLPFLLISSFSTYKVLQSSVTTLSLKQFKSKDFVVNNTEQIVKKDLNEVPKTMIVEESKPGTWDMLLSTNFYYFWQFMLPLEHVPVRGRLQKTAGVLEYVHLAFISVLLLLSWKLPLRNYLLASLIMLTPFMGLIPATYMNITWVSDQHLYLALPFFLIFFLGLLEKMKYRKKEVLPFIALIGFMIVSFRATGLYENEIVFYESSLKSDPTNLPLYYNLATTHQRAGDTKKAYRTLELVIELAEDEPLIAGSKYLPYIKQLRNELLNQARN